jgi:hypothetical protein
MSKDTLPVPSSSHRRVGVIVRALSIDKYAYELMQEMAPTRKSYGNFLSALILAEHARRQERQRRLQKDQATMGG